MSHAATRASRVPTPPLETRLGAEFGRLTNVSATGALVRTSAPFTAGRQCPLIVNLPAAPAALSVRIVRSQPVPVDLPGAVSPAPQYLVGVRFTELSASAKHAIATLCGAAFTQHDEAEHVADAGLSRRAAPSGDEFFEALDGHALVVGGDRWRLAIYAVVVEANRRWIELQVHGPARLEIRLNMAADRTPSDVLDRLRAFLRERPGWSIDGIVDSVTLD